MTVEDTTIQVNFGSRQVTASVRRSERRNLRIEVDPGSAVRVTVPLDADYQEIVRRVNRRSGWIFRQLDQIESQPPQTPERRYLSGETHLLLGRQYRLAIEKADSAHVWIDGSRIVVGARKIDDHAQCRRLLTAFYALKARRVFRDRLEVVFPPFARRGLQQPRVIVRQLSKRWGSFTPKGRIVLNVDLIRASPSLIDYVICHELIHAFHPDHGQEWRSLFDSVMPDWRSRKARLEKSLR